MKKYCLIIISFFLLGALTAQASGIQDVFAALVKSNNLPVNKQSYCIENATSEIAGYNQNVKVIPASISKLYTFDFALNTLGGGFRYSTDVYLNGDTLYLNGGGDPHFVIENLRAIIQKVSNEQHITIAHFVFSPHFYFDWKQTPSAIVSSITAALKENSGAKISSKFTVAYAQNDYSSSGVRYQFQSAPLSILVKQINDYSTNVSADILFQKAGGATAFSTYMLTTYGASSSVVKFGTGSGLSDNYTTCDLTLKVLQHLEKTATATGIGIENIMSMPRVDPGILQKTLLSVATTTGIVAKSGFLDYHHNFGGIAYTTSGPVYFAVFGGYSRIKDEQKAEKFVETFVEKFLSNYTQVSLGYTAHNDVNGNTLITQLGS